jgi:hypothetical protein
MSLTDPFGKRISVFIAWRRGEGEKGFFWGYRLKDQKGSLPRIFACISNKISVETARHLIQSAGFFVISVKDPKSR